MGFFERGPSPEAATPSIEGKADLQKEFDRLRIEKGNGTALEFLVANYDRNPHFADRQALRLAAGMSRNLDSALVRSSADNFRAQLYAEFRELSERQKTLQGGFRRFVEMALSEMPPEEGEVSVPTAEKEAQFRAFVLEGADRQPPDKSGEFVEPSRRLNYRKAANESIARTEDIEKGLRAVDAILAKAEARGEAA